MISDEDFKFLLDKSQGSKKILEIGTGTGKSTAALRLCLLYTSPSPRDRTRSRMPSSA